MITSKNTLWTGYIALSVFTVLYVPYFFPVKTSTSESYIFGYSNFCATILVLALAAAFAIWSRGFNLDFPRSPFSAKVPAKFLFLSLAIEFSACVIVYLQSFRSAPAWEGMQIVNRAYLVSLHKRPYIDFEFPWGCAFLYPPNWLAKLFRTNVVNGYLLYWVLVSLVGIFLLFVAINLLDFPTKRKTTIFLLFSFCAVLEVPCLGINYSLLRYTLPLIFVLIVHRTNRQSRSELTPRIAAGVLATVFSGILMLISPEVTIAHLFACSALLFPRSSSTPFVRRFGGYIFTLLCFACIIGLSLRLHVLDSLFLDGGGANSLPITFGPAILSLFAAIVLCACYLNRRMTTGGIRDNTIALILFAVPMTAASLGRCDPAHIIFNSLGFFIPALCYASVSPRAWKVFSAFFLIGPIGLLTFLWTLGLLFSLAGPSARAFPRTLTTIYGETPDDLFEAPFGYQPNAKGFFFSTQVDYGFFFGSADANTPRSVSIQIDELTSHPKRNLLLPKNYAEGFCEISERHERIVVSALTGTPYFGNVIHPQSVRKPLCDYIAEHYSKSEAATTTNYEYELWKPQAEVVAQMPKQASAP